MSNRPAKRGHSAGYDARGPQDVVIAMFDVLGFKTMVKEKPLGQLNEEYRGLLRLKQQAGRVPLLSLRGVDEWSSPSAVFSDTILFWASAEPESTSSLLTTCSVLIAEGLTWGWPLRGSIAAGPCVLDREARVFVGQPIIDAYLLERAQDWIGAALHPSCLQHPVVGNYVSHDENVRRYPVPLKEKCLSTIEYAVEWSSRLAEPTEKLEALRKTAGDHTRKYDNAIAFVRATT